MTAVERGDDWPETLFLLGKVHLRLHHLTGAFNFFHKASARDEKSLLTTMALAIVLFLKGSIDESLAILLKAAEIVPDDEVLQFFLACCHLKKDLPHLSLAAFYKALELTRTNEETFLMLGNVLMQQREEEKACEAYKKAISIDPNYVDAYMNLGIVMQTFETLQEAAHYYRKAMFLQASLQYTFHPLLEWSGEKGLRFSILKHAGQALFLGEPPP